MRTQRNRSPGAVTAVVLAAACTAGGPPEAGDGAAPTVRPGVERFVQDPPAVVRGRRVGLITNHTGIDRVRNSTIDLLHAMDDLELVALFSPEHGIRGTVPPGVRIDSSIDERTGLPIHSLYGETRIPTPAMLEGIEVLVFDIQDVGARPYTYVWTMAHAMRAAGEHDIAFVVLDRPNPIGGIAIEGNVLEPAFASFVGLYPVPSRHGLTAGEIARMVRGEWGVDVDLTIVPVEGWRRSMWFDDTGLPWDPPSPNLPTLEAATHYPGTVFFEATNLSEGRGSDRPFEQTGAPWLRAAETADTLNALGLPGVRFEAVTFDVRPDARKFPGLTLPGLRFVLTDRDAYRPVAAALHAIAVIRRLHPADFVWTGAGGTGPLWIERLGGTAALRPAIEDGSLAALLEAWRADERRFAEQREPYLLYR
jgi:uncharacterized protein YbbC (DUF1343 family)